MTSMMSSILLLYLYVFLSFAFAYPSVATAMNIGNARNMFNKWMVEYEVSYANSHDEQKRFKIFSRNLEYINNFNSNGNQTYKMGLNQFSDLTDKEFLSKIGGDGCLKSEILPTREEVPHMNKSNTNENNVPSRVDWEEKGHLNPPRSQGRCGSCWAFAAITAIEATAKMRTGFLPKLSVQQVLDCDNVSKGCNGGRPQHALNYAYWYGGLASEESYPYVAKKGECRKNVSAVATIIGWNNLPRNNEVKLMEAVLKQPVTAGIFFAPETFKHYKSGIITEAKICDGKKINHFVVIIGYGTSPEGIKYWRIRNSWGPKWGDGGNAKIAREIPGKHGGLCGIASDVAAPSIFK